MQSTTHGTVSPGQHVRVTYYLDVISSWCFWAEPAWAQLRQRYAGRGVEFDWRIALMDSSGLPVSVAQEAWFYRRSGVLNRSPFMLSTDWYEPARPEYLAPNAVAEAARDLGVTDDTVRLAIARAGLVEGRRIGEWEVALEAASRAAGLDAAKLAARAKSSEVAERMRASTAAFHALQVTQRPTFTLVSTIDDRATFSGLIAVEPLAATIDAVLNDLAGYAAWQAHFGPPPRD